MCKIKSGSLIKNSQDVQNLVIGIIFRQEEVYRKETICKIVKVHMRGSTVMMSQNRILELVSKNLDMLCRNNKISCHNGYYEPKTCFLENYVRR